MVHMWFRILAPTRYKLRPCPDIAQHNGTGAAWIQTLL